jgi:hypothetical protein
MARDIKGKACPFTLNNQPRRILAVGDDQPADRECLGDLCAAYADGDCALVTGSLLVANNVGYLAGMIEKNLVPAVQAQVFIAQRVAEVQGVKFPAPPDNVHPIKKQ